MAYTVSPVSSSNTGQTATFVTVEVVSF